jgi:hypothetical protein
VILVFLYPYSVRYVCKLDSWAHILWAFGLALKLGVTFSEQAKLPQMKARKSQCALENKSMESMKTTATGKNKVTPSPTIYSSSEELYPTIHGVKGEQSKARNAERAHFQDWPR